ncbi:hypothetical protein [Massilia sp. erpn]|uniref:hypothetical protein n=1 Tax=Massilia sp. erpn TaxID=2738142 RepID=UPI0021067C75|nr:hypothetical protein [Massilia sp. erpn]UTY55870.1 hypothetical protein HPQ68_00915 [Massilia sp. erpn]
MTIPFLRRLAVAAMLSLTSLSASAQWTVYDPVNWIQNMISSRSAVANEINTARTLIQQVNAARDLARSTAGLKNVAALAGVEQAHGLYRSLIEVDGRLDMNLERNARILQDLRAQFGASNMSWEQFATSRKQMESQQRQLSRDRYNAIAQALEETARRRQAIVAQLSQVQGQTEAMQTLGAALDVLIGQNQQIVAAMAAKDKTSEDQANRSAAEEQWARNQLELYQQRLRQAAQKY